MRGGPMFVVACLTTIAIPFAMLIVEPKPAPIPVVRVSSAIALEMCNHIEFVVVTKSNGDSTLLLDPSREAIELLDKTVSDPKRKQVVHMQCPHPSNTI